jgi:hypothetical protein
MGADKNSSLKRELGLCPKFTTKDSHTSLPRSRSHSGPTNPRNKPQTIPKRKHDSRSKGLSYPATALVDSQRGRGGRSVRTGGDSPRPTSGRSVKRNRTTGSAPRNSDGPYPTRGLSEGNSCRADGPRPLSGRSAKPLTARKSWPNGSKRRRSRTRDEP